MAEPSIERFSSDYYLVDSDVLTWSWETAHMDADLYQTLAKMFGEPVVGMVDGSHYNFKPSKNVQTNECAIPEENRASNPSALLIRG